MSRGALAALLLGSLGGVGCSPSPCQRVCTKLSTCKVVASESQCQKDCQAPPNGGTTCHNEDAIATCIEGATCEQLMDVTSTLQCPTCD